MSIAVSEWCCRFPNPTPDEVSKGFLQKVNFWGQCVGNEFIELRLCTSLMCGCPTEPFLVQGGPCWAPEVTHGRTDCISCVMQMLSKGRVTAAGHKVLSPESSSQGFRMSTRCYFTPSTCTPAMSWKHRSTCLILNEAKEVFFSALIIANPNSLHSQSVPDRNQKRLLLFFFLFSSCASLTEQKSIVPGGCSLNCSCLLCCEQASSYRT